MSLDTMAIATNASRTIHCIHVVPDIAEEASGPTYSVVRLCKSLIAAGASIDLAALDSSPTAGTLPFLHTFKVGFGPRRLGRSSAMFQWLREASRSGQVHVIHSHILWQMNSIYPSWATKRTTTKLIVSPRGSLSPWAMKSGSRVKRLFWPLLQRPALKAASCIHATAAHEYEDIRRLGLRQPVCILPNGIDSPPELRGVIAKSEELLYLGRLHPAKGIDNLLRAWAILQNEFPSWRLTIAGPRETYGKGDHYANYLHELAGSLKLDRVTFSGALYGEDKFRAFRDAAIFVLPTHSENFGMTVAEALACGTPAVVTKGAPWQGLEKHRAGWWIDIGVDPLIRCLRNAMSLSLDKLADMGKSGEDWMKKDYSWSQIGQKMLETYHWLCFGGSRPEHVVLD